MINSGFSMISALSHFQTSPYFSERWWKKNQLLHGGGLRLYAVALHCIFAVVMCLFWVGWNSRATPSMGNPGKTANFGGFTKWIQVGILPSSCTPGKSNTCWKSLLNCAGTSLSFSHTAQRSFRWRQSHLSLLSQALRFGQPCVFPSQSLGGDLGVAGSCRCLISWNSIVNHPTWLVVWNILIFPYLGNSHPN